MCHHHRNQHAKLIITIDDGHTFAKYWNDQVHFVRLNLHRHWITSNRLWNRSRFWWLVPVVWAVNCSRIWHWWAFVIFTSSTWTPSTCPIWIVNFCSGAKISAAQKHNVPQNSSMNGNLKTIHRCTGSFSFRFSILCVFHLILGFHRAT